MPELMQVINVGCTLTGHKLGDMFCMVMQSDGKSTKFDGITELKIGEARGWIRPSDCNFNFDIIDDATCEKVGTELWCRVHRRKD